MLKRLLLLFWAGSLAGLLVLLTPPAPAQAEGPLIHSVTTNAAAYPDAEIPQYQKFEITFQVDTPAQNKYLPYDPAPPPGLAPGQGVSVAAQFSLDNWQTVYTQPAFYYQTFEDEIKNNQEWFYPTANFAWKVRFAPPQAGAWRFRLTAQDAGGLSQSQPFSFTVAPSAKPGFIRVSPTDPRYFEFDDGRYFPGLGYNMNFSQISWTNPVLDNQANFEQMGANGIQLVRLWLSQWAIYGSAWNPWNSIIPQQHGAYIPYTGLSINQSYPGSELSMRIESSHNPCMFIGAWKAKPAVKRNTTYRVRLRYKTVDLAGPRVSGQPYGLVAKTGGWLSDCAEPGVGALVTPHQPQNSGDWQILEGSLTTGQNDFLPNFYLVTENVTAGRAFVDYVWIEEDLGDGEYGPNIISKPWMAHHLYMEQRNAYAFDQVLALAEQNDVYLRPVIHEKNDWIFNRITYSGTLTSTAGNNRFYGNFRAMTKGRWLQQAWWRYLQARWGYSPHIHSWELLNEGDPWNGRHYALTDELGKFMHCRVFDAPVGAGDGQACAYDHPNDHPVSTSTWHSFPRDQFWANPAYPNVDFADLHQYIAEDDPLFTDAVSMTVTPSRQFGAQQPGGAGKPLIRGETGLGDPNSPVKNDTDGVWLHNYLWGGLNAGGLIESYWYANKHIYFNGVDHRPIYRTLYNFVRDLPLNNGHYQAAEASASDPALRVLGQKDLVNGQAHLWLQNRNHTWANVVAGASIPALTSTVVISGFQPGQSYALQWWDPYQPDPAQQIIAVEPVVANSAGALAFSVDDLATDIALKIFLQD